METIPDMFGSIKTAMIEVFDERYAAVTEVATVTATTTIFTATPHGG